MITLLKLSQVAVSLAVIGFFWLFYAGAMVIFASTVGLVYLLAAVGATKNNRFAIWIAFVFSAVTAVLSALGVGKFIQNGFAFLSGNFDQQSGVYLTPYVLLAISIAAALVVVLHLVSYRWMLQGQANKNA